MSVMLDVIGAALLVGMLMLTILNVNVNMTLETFKSASEFHTQTELIQLARIIEFDIYKMGYGVAKPSTVKVRWRKSLPRTVNSLRRSSPVATPGSTCTARRGSSARTPRRFWSSALPNT